MGWDGTRMEPSIEDGVVQELQNSRAPCACRQSAQECGRLLHVRHGHNLVEGCNRALQEGGYDDRQQQEGRKEEGVIEEDEVHHCTSWISWGP